MIVFINDILQIPEKDYKFTSGTNILFTSAPTAGSKLKFLFQPGPKFIYFMFSYCDFYYDVFFKRYN